MILIEWLSKIEIAHEFENFNIWIFYHAITYISDFEWSRIIIVHIDAKTLFQLQQRFYYESELFKFKKTLCYFDNDYQYHCRLIMIHRICRWAQGARDTGDTPVYMTDFLSLHRSVLALQTRGTGIYWFSKWQTYVSTPVLCRNC